MPTFITPQSKPQNIKPRPRVNPRVNHRISEYKTTEHTEKIMFRNHGTHTEHTEKINITLQKNISPEQTNILPEQQWNTTKSRNKNNFQTIIYSIKISECHCIKNTMQKKEKKRIYFLFALGRECCSGKLICSGELFCSGERNFKYVEIRRNA